VESHDHRQNCKQDPSVDTVLALGAPRSRWPRCRSVEKNAGRLGQGRHLLTPTPRGSSTRSRTVMCSGRWTSSRSCRAILSVDLAVAVFEQTANVIGGWAADVDRVRRSSTKSNVEAGCRVLQKNGNPALMTYTN